MRFSPSVWLQEAYLEKAPPPASFIVVAEFLEAVELVCPFLQAAQELLSAPRHCLISLTVLTTAVI